MDSKRISKHNHLIHESVSQILSKEGFRLYKNALVTITHVNITPDLSIARVNVSVFNDPEPQKVVDTLNSNKREFRGLLGNMIRNQVRKIPEIQFYLDEAMERSARIEEIFKELHAKEDKPDKE